MRARNRHTTRIDEDDARCREQRTADGEQWTVDVRDREQYLIPRHFRLVGDYVFAAVSPPRLCDDRVTFLNFAIDEVT